MKTPCRRRQKQANHKQNTRQEINCYSTWQKPALAIISKLDNSPWCPKHGQELVIHIRSSPVWFTSISSSSLFVIFIGFCMTFVVESYEKHSVGQRWVSYKKCAKDKTLKHSLMCISCYFTRLSNQWLQAVPNFGLSEWKLSGWSLRTVFAMRG